MEPEIARRCKSCGAAIRARSAFCPQCGAAVSEESAASGAPVAAPENSQPGVADSRANIETVAPLPATETAVETEAAMKMETPVAAVAVAATDVAAPASPAENPSPAGAAVAPASVSPEAVIEKMQRVRAVDGTTAPARAVADDGVRHRADKLRRASTVVLDEAAADPSLRFVLVATALIIISLVLLLLARVI